MMNGIIRTTATQYEEQRKKEFCNMLTKIINDYILPKFGQHVIKFNIELGLFTSEQYGSYRIPFFDVEGGEVCYIVADTIIGEWKVFEVKNKKNMNFKETLQDGLEDEPWED